MTTNPRRATRAAALALGIVAVTATTAAADTSWTATDASSVSLTGQWSTTDHSGTRLAPRPQRRAESTSRQQRRTREARRSAFFRPNTQCRPVRSGLWRVRPGDTIDLIARCTGATRGQLTVWNPGLIRGTTVYADSRLAISRRAADRAADQREQAARTGARVGSW